MLRTLPGASAMHPWVRKSVDRVWLGWRWFVVVGLVWLCQTSTCLAEAGQEQEEKTKNYVPVYMIILFSLGLSLLIVCRSARRDEKIRRE
jgi:hypothetical protein